MKKRFTAIIAMALCLCLSVSAQTLNIKVGNATYAVAAAQAGDMTYSNGETLEVLGKTFTISDISSLVVDESSVTDNTVNVVYSGTSASVTVAGNIMKYLTVTVSGADVSIIADSNLASEITYTLSGSTTDGMLYMDGEYKATFVLNGVSITNTDGPAINIECGKRIAVELADGTTNTLVDGASGSQKACFMVNGHTEFKGAGSLTITGNKKHGFWGDEYVELKKSTGTITVASSVGDGFNLNQYYLQKGGSVVMSNIGDDGIAVAATDDTTDEYNGQIMLEGGSMNLAITATAAKGIKADSTITISDGTYTISTSGNGTYDTDDADTKAAACIGSDSHVVISGGTLNLTSTGTGGKGINCDETLTISGGTITIKTTGTAYVYGSLDSSAKGIKADGNLQITGGTISVTTTGGEGSEGIESKSVMTIDGGTIEVNSYDDGLNSSSHMYINGGYIYVNSTNNDGLDANGNLYVNGGTVVAYGARSPECGIDSNEEGGYGVYVNGGTLIGIGGGTSKPLSSSTQPSIIYTGSVSNGTTLAIKKSDGTAILGFTMGKSYSGSATFLITSPDLVKGSSYTLYGGASVSGDDWHGLYSPVTISSTGSTLGTISSLSSPYSTLGSGGGRP